MEPYFSFISRTPNFNLHVEKGHIETVKLHLKQIGIDVNAKDIYLSYLIFTLNI